MPTLLLQTPGRRKGASQEFLLPVCGLKGHAGDHFAGQAQIGQVAGREGAQFLHRPVIDPTTLQSEAHILEKGQEALGKGAGGGAGAVYICHDTRAFSSGAAGAFYRAAGIKMGQMLQLHNSHGAQCCYAANAWPGFIKLLSFSAASLKFKAICKAALEFPARIATLRGKTDTKG